MKHKLKLEPRLKYTLNVEDADGHDRSLTEKQMAEASAQYEQDQVSAFKWPRDMYLSS